MSTQGTLPPASGKPARLPMTASFIILRIIAALMLVGSLSNLVMSTSMGDELAAMGLRPNMAYLAIVTVLSVIAAVLMWQDKRAGIIIAIILQVIAIPVGMMQLDKVQMPGEFGNDPFARSLFETTKWGTVALNIAWIIGLLALMYVRNNARKEADDILEMEV